MSKILKTVVMLIVIYAVPLLGNFGLLGNLRIILLLIAGVIMFQTQPEMKISEAKDKKKTDRNSIFMILLAGGLSQIAAIIEWAYFKPAPTVIGNRLVVAAGIAMLVGGLAFRYWAIRTLKEFFTSTVQVKAGHLVIQRGPYKIVRHPSYLGALVAIMGTCFVLEAPIAAVVSFCSMVYAYVVRVNAEEIALVGELGDAYREFQRVRRYKVIPLIW